MTSISLSEIPFFVVYPLFLVMYPSISQRFEHALIIEDLYISFLNVLTLFSNYFGGSDYPVLLFLPIVPVFTVLIVYT